MALINEGTDLQKLSEEVEVAVKNEWERIAHISFFSTAIKTNCTLNSNDYQQQIKQHLDIYWLFEPTTLGYSKAFEEIERKLGAIKNVRLFEQFNRGLGEKGRKCSIDGFRNVKFYRVSQSQDDRIQAIPITNKNLNIIFSFRLKIIFFLF